MFTILRHTHTRMHLTIKFKRIFMEVTGFAHSLEVIPLS